MKAAIFDVDGTLLDSMSVWEDIGERYLASQNITAEKNLRATLHTMSLEQGAAWMKEKYQLDKSISQIIEEVLKIVSDFYRFEAPLKPGVKKTLEWFKERNIQMTVATSGNRELTEAALARNGILDYFEQILCRQNRMRHLYLRMRFTQRKLQKKQDLWLLVSMMKKTGRIFPK